MVSNSNSIASVTAVDGVTIKTGATGQIYVDDNELPITREVGEHELEIIELQADAGITPLDHDTLISETFTDADGLNNTINTGLTTATFSTNKYTRTVYGIYAHWKFEADGTDEEGNATLTMTNDTYAAGQVDNAVTFNGTSTTAKDPFNASNNIVDKMSISGWVYPVSLVATLHIINMGNGNGGQHNNFAFSVTAAGKISLEIRDGGNAPKNTTSTDTISTGAWKHIAVRWDKTKNSGNPQIYIDGSEVAAYDSQTALTGDAGAELDADLCIGHNVWSGTPSYGSSKIDDLFYFQDYITEAQIVAHAAGTPPTSTSYDTVEVVITLPTITGTITHTELIIDDPDRETGDAITYALNDGTNEDSGLAVNTKNALTTVDGSSLSGDKLIISLTKKAAGATDGVPSLKTIALKLWK